MASSLNADNGVVSGSSGLKSTADTSGVLALQSNGSTALSISTGLVTTLTNPLPVGSGGTGIATTPTAGTVPYGNGTTLAYTAAGTSGQVLQSNGASAPSWVAAGGGEVKVWVYVTMSAGTPTLQNSNNVSSITDGGVGTFTVNMSVTRTSQYYATSASVWATAFTASTRPESSTPTTKFWVYTYNTAGTLTDPTFSWSAMSAGAN